MTRPKQDRSAQNRAALKSRSRFFVRLSAFLRICLSDITMPTLRKIPSYITGLSGFSVERNLHLAAQYAAARTLEMVVIDLLVGYTQPLSMHFRSLERIQAHDVLSLFRASRAL